MADFKLYHFDLRGAAEVSRLVLALAGQQYEDVRWPIDEWSKYKPDAPFGQGPWLEYKGKKIGQSVAVACFLARELGLYGKTNWDAAVIDQVIHIYWDMIGEWQKSFYKGEATRMEIERKLREEECAKFFGFFVKLLKENGNNGHFVGDAITLADLYVYDVTFQMKKAVGYDATANFPEVKKLYDAVDSDPKIKSYVAQRKDTPL